MSSCVTVLPRPQTVNVISRRPLILVGKLLKHVLYCQNVMHVSLKQADAYLQYDKFQCHACVESESCEYYLPFGRWIVVLFHRLMKNT